MDRGCRQDLVVECSIQERTLFLFFLPVAVGMVTVNRDSYLIGCSLDGNWMFAVWSPGKCVVIDTLWLGSGQGMMGVDAHSRLGLEVGGWRLGVGDLCCIGIAMHC